MMFPSLSRRSDSEIKFTFDSRSPLRTHEQSLVNESHFKTMDSASAFLTTRHVQQKAKLQLDPVERVLSTLRGQRSQSLDLLIGKCQKSYRPEDANAVKESLALAQHRIKALLSELVRPQKDSNSYASIKSRKKFLQDEDYVSRAEVRRMMADNRMKFKRARVIAIGK